MDLVDSTVKSLRSLANERRERYMEIIIIIFLKKQIFPCLLIFYFCISFCLFTHSFFGFFVFFVFVLFLK